MIIISAGMQKAGTGWFYNLTNEILVASGHQDARDVRKRYRLHSVLKHRNCNMARPTFYKLARLAVPHWSGNTFVVKTHQKPSRSLRLLLRSDWMAKATYIYRDPRDVAVSAHNHGRRIRAAGETHTFAKLITLEDAIYRTCKYLENWEVWQHAPNTLMIKYENLKTSPVHSLKRVADFLGVQMPEDKLPAIISRYDKNKIDEQKRIQLHFDKGVSGRFREVMSADQIDLCDREFGPYLTRMGYQP